MTTETMNKNKICSFSGKKAGLPKSSKIATASTFFAHSIQCSGVFIEPKSTC
jgi:hypothetical protein